MRWGEFERDAAVLAKKVRPLLEGPGVVLLATIRRDGSPRVSPAEPFFWDGELWLGMMWRSRKVTDLRRDSRLLVHSAVTSADGAPGEAKVRGLAVPEADSGRRLAFCRAVAAALPHWGQLDPERVELFWVDVESVCVINYVGEGDQHVMLWPARRKFVRPATSATSVGDPEAVDTF